jgi:RNA polymerase sigma-70 factor (ECF subfamily)
VAPVLAAETLGDHFDRLYRAGLGDVRLARGRDDLVQEAYARVLAKQRIIDTEDALAYLLVVLRNVFLSSLRRRDRRPRTTPFEGAEERLAAPASGSGSPSAALAAREVLAAVAALPADQRDVVAYVDVAGVSYAEAAEALGVPIGPVMSRLHRGRGRVAASVGR